ncbi:MAG: PLP-dependent aminotransferase family protein [Dehalococcoidia bacterium]|uniref:aminotransferase-like domain-containing protein n=1 Tax=Candidatus Amarobacter glycogenicus TaxID=3140699 RepID=UPI0031371657|nr:PLP-dependent aminotransferase family protein [Dehalococcoidia bacterium]MBK6560383.1 PLP-dependent aminotransferase family protein [Dehalococcoidia bacterium]MBK7125984.1 PLP-dependent aminotransferase family protein [Dehalococcoidia bacterium]MBK7328361.1 PLP-dependent aminotransferase family protein [Dehalococcoidia bacterium]MBK8559561.1 PLP-dependent aminotransferase family protein [Dehalococcoidia bacterium]
MDYQQLLADRTRLMEASVIREILKVASSPGMISLAGGLPAAESFPLEIMEELMGAVLGKYGSKALQYDASEGWGPLREALVPHLAARGVTTTADGVLIMSGSQSLLDGIGKILISPGDYVAVEAPTYLGALQAFNPYEPHYLEIETDDGGLIPESLERVLSGQRVKLVYLVPTFQNPTGRTLSLARRKQVADILKRHDTLLLEDDPYSDLRYSGERVPPIKSLAPEHVVYSTTLSKTFAPGLRIGVCIAPEFIQRWLVTARQGVDLHTNTLAQALAAEYLTGGYLDRQLPRIIELYAPRQLAMLDALERHMPEDFTWSHPEGGMFVWVEGPKGFDAVELQRRVLEHGVAFVPGRYFYVNEEEGAATLRMNFTAADAATIEHAVGVIADVMAEML